MYSPGKELCGRAVCKESWFGFQTRINELKGKLSKSFSEWRRQLEEDEEYALKLIDEEGLRALSQIRSCSEALNKRMEQITLIDGETQRLVQRDHLSFIQILKQLLSRVTETRRVTDPDVPALTLNLSNISQLIQKRLNGSEKYHSDILGIIGENSGFSSEDSRVEFLHLFPLHNSELVRVSDSGLEGGPGELTVNINRRDIRFIRILRSIRGTNTDTPTLQLSIIDLSGITLSDQSLLSSPGQRSPMSLDPKTVNWNLVLSDDLRSVTWTEQEQPYPPHPERFKDHPQVLCSQSFSSGSHSWDVETYGNRWRIGIVCGSAERERRGSFLGNSSKSWCLYFHSGSLTAGHNSQFTALPLTPSNIRIRVQLDYEAGTLSFHRVTDSQRHLHTFQTTFTEPVFPAFYCRNKSLKL
ncbi:E3 ubiquitin-protein ligase TRIM39-like [Heptranchias perlo]|uniref:E3 ubiquitin-protein ligase TRIM39-like n=1 Tax=Heptranchias perlo TaxID=212740 RepID=UPI00355999C7